MREQNNFKRWELVFVPSFILIGIDIILRIFIAIYAIILSDSENTTFEFIGILSVNIITSIIIFSVSRRNKKGIESFLKMRLISESDNLINDRISFNDLAISTRIWKLKNNYFLVAFFLASPLIITTSLWVVSPVGLNTSYLFLLFIINTFLLYLIRNNFISKKIISIKLNNEKLVPSRRLELIRFLNRKSINKSKKLLSDYNDLMILELQTKVKIYRERLENISYEAIFLGALTFATFAQIVFNDAFKNQAYASNHFIEDISYSLMHIFFSETQSVSQIEFMILIAAGSLLSSVFYIVLLMKRFAILKSIELAQLKIEKANNWNSREELLIEKDVTLSNQIIKFTDQIQIELSHANQMTSEINSNLNILTIMRFIGVFCFFIVLLISAKYIHQNLYILVLFVTFYGVITSLLLNKSYLFDRLKMPAKIKAKVDKSRSFQHIISKKEESNF